MALIQYFTVAPVTANNGKLECSAASVRYRMISPVAQLARRGHRMGINRIPQDFSGPLDPAKVAADTVVFCKSLSPANVPFANALQAKGKSIILDLCDNYFDHPIVGDKYRDHTIAMCRLATRVVASTPRLAALIHASTGVEATVISDPVEGPRGAPCFEPKFPRIKVLWFGHQSNWESLVSLLPSLAELAKTWPMELAVVTKPIDSVTEGVAAANREYAPALKTELRTWSTAEVWASLKACDIVVIPSLQSEFNDAKSPNRIAEALWAGRCVVAHPLPAYLPFAPFACVQDDIVAGIRFALENSAEMLERITRGQLHVISHHSPFVIASAWEQALGVAPASRPLQLNLGCGDKILPNYINVDVVEAREDAVPDVVCDLHQLTPFADNAVDEILSVHVVEHFWRWDVLDVLKEWVRVLKPGGKMILECPNLESACRHFLEDPAVRAREDKRGQRSMWVFYGDPVWKDPLMIHRWGYTPDSLAVLMRDAGLVNVQQEPAQYKLREPRDMRITGCKPG
jgi:SAM-dependent methyltransferase